MHRDFADFLPLFSYSPVDMLLFCYSTNKFFFAPSFAMLLKFRANSLRVSEIRDRNVVHLSIVVYNNNNNNNKQICIGPGSVLVSRERRESLREEECL